MERKAVADAHSSERYTGGLDGPEHALHSPLPSHTQTHSSKPLEDPNLSLCARSLVPSAAGLKAGRQATGRDDDGAAEPVEANVVRKALPVLPWMRVPVSIEAGTGIPITDVRGLHQGLCSALRAEGYEELFAVQAAVWRLTAGGHSAAHDLCISAPTGSGKTLAYALPIVSALLGRQSCTLRALVVLPTRDLAGQVYRLFARLCPPAGLTVGLMAGKAHQSTEASAFVSESGMSTVDVVVATPGRLRAHLRGTTGFRLTHLRFLVVDETDRLLRQAYQDWLPIVSAATAPDALAGRGENHSGGPARGLSSVESRRVVKFVVSATLTRDPSKIERLGLHCPRYIAQSSEDHRYKLPRELAEYKLLCPAQRKPALLAALLAELAPQGPTIVFAASVLTAHRLWKFIEALPCLTMRSVEFSSLVPASKRAANLAAFKSGSVQVLMASDAMTRGMDVEAVAHVVNYDAPVYAKTYVHRCGRTARAGRAGRAFTLLRKQEMRHFKAMLRKVDNTFVKDYAPDAELMASLAPEVEAALAGMQGLEDPDE